MGCDACDTAHGPPAEEVYPLRVGTGTVLLIGCEDHVEELMEAYRG